MIRTLLERLKFSTGAPEGAVTVDGVDGRELLSLTEVFGGSVQGKFIILISENKEYLYRSKLDDFLLKKAGKGFLQIHHAHFVRPSCIRSLDQIEDGPVRVTLTNGEVMPVSKAYLPALQHALARDKSADK